MIFFDKREREVHSRSNARGRIDVFVPNEDGIGINMRARSSPDQNLAPVPMSRRAPAVQQTSPGQKHRPGAYRADTTDAAGNLSQPARYFRADFVAFNR